MPLCLSSVFGERSWNCRIWSSNPECPRQLGGTAAYGWAPAVKVNLHRGDWLLRVRSHWAEVGNGPGDPLVIQLPGPGRGLAQTGRARRSGQDTDSAASQPTSRETMTLGELLLVIDRRKINICKMPT